MVEINSWFFDFEKMLAHRDKTWKHYRPDDHNTRSISINFGRVFVYGRVGECMEGFFAEPEDHFNQKIVEAYLAYVAEKHLLE